MKNFRRHISRSSPCLNAEFTQNPLDVLADRPRACPENFGDLVVPLALAHPVQAFPRSSRGIKHEAGCILADTIQFLFLRARNIPEQGISENKVRYGALSFFSISCGQAFEQRSNWEISTETLVRGKRLTARSHS